MTGDPTVSARALASRRNGARSRGPGTAAGKAKSARNALKHGLCARTLLLDDEDAAALAALASAARAELAPEGALQAELVTRIVAAAWRARRADRLEAALLSRHLAEQPGDPQAALGHGLMRDGHGSRALDTLVRYRGTVLAELFRALGALKALQAELHDRQAMCAPAIGRSNDDLCTSTARRPASSQQRNEPEKGRQDNMLVWACRADPSGMVSATVLDSQADCGARHGLPAAAGRAGSPARKFSQPDGAAGNSRPTR